MEDIPKPRGADQAPIEPASDRQVDPHKRQSKVGLA